MVMGLSEEPSAHTADTQAVGAIRMADNADRSPPVSLASVQPALRGEDASLSAAANAALMRLHSASGTDSPADMALDLPVDAVPLDDGPAFSSFVAMMVASDPAIEGLSALTDRPPDLVLTNLFLSEKARRADDPMTLDPPSDLVSVFGQDSKVRQARLARWLSRYYRRDPEDVARFVRYAWDSGARNGVDPLLIVAVMCIESSLNPQAVSHKGARGLMQVLVAAHEQKFDPFGGPGNAHHPRVSIEVGTRILQRMIAVAGSVEGALKHYVGARFFKSDGGYGAKVISMRERAWAASMGYSIPRKPALQPAIEHANNAQTAVAAHTSTAQR